MKGVAIGLVRVQGYSVIARVSDCGRLVLNEMEGVYRRTMTPGL